MTDRGGAPSRAGQNRIGRHKVLQTEMLPKKVIRLLTSLFMATLLQSAHGEDGGRHAHTDPHHPAEAERRGREIRLGMSTALTGPAAQLGRNMQAGVQLALDEVNRAGGIQGRPLRLITYDDGYEPARTAPNMRKLIDQDEVVAVIGNVGTPTAVAAIPIAQSKKTLLFGAFSGAGVLRKTPPDRYVINYRASYAEETATMVKGLVEDAGIQVEEIALFTQRDSYGDAGYIGAITAMKEYGLKDDLHVPHGRYERNTGVVENALADILLTDKPIRAVIMVGAYEPCAKFIKLARQHDFHPLFLNISFVGSEPLGDALGEAGDGVIITQVVPPPVMNLPIIRDYRNALKASDADIQINVGSLEGYIAGRTLSLGLQKIEGPVTREGVVEALESLGTFDLGLGQPLTLTPDRHQACRQVWPTVLREGKLVPFSFKELHQQRVDRG